MSETAVTLLSGGMDSAVASAWAKEQGYALIALSVDYGQRPRAELEAARDLAGWLETKEHVVLQVNLRAVGGSALTDDIEIPTGEGGTEIPVTDVPARNTLLLSLALGLAESRAAAAIVIGANSIDYSGYPDCRPEFLDAFRHVIETGTKAGVEGRAPQLLAPLIALSKPAIVELGTRLGVPFERTLSCYNPDESGRACGRCESCRLRRRGFQEAGVDDPTSYFKQNTTF